MEIRSQRQDGFGVVPTARSRIVDLISAQSCGNQLNVRIEPLALIRDARIRDVIE